MSTQMRTETPKILLAIGVVTLVALTLLAGSAAANPLPVATGVDFAGGSGGTLSYTSGLGNALSVTGATIDTIKQRPSNDSFAIVGGLLDLITGGCATGCSINPTTLNSNPHFADGGSISITGSIPSLTGDPSGTLISGTWDSTLLVPQFGQTCKLTAATLNPTTGGVGMRGCALITSINPLLAADLGFPTLTGNGFLAELFFDVTLSGSTYSGEILHSDFNLVPSTPEPATLALMGAGLLFLGSLGRKKLLAGLGAR